MHDCTEETCYFGCCPECDWPLTEHGWSYRNIYKYHFWYCDRHKTRWGGDYGLFSSWQFETVHDWARAVAHLAGYRSVGRSGS